MRAFILFLTTISFQGIVFAQGLSGPSATTTGSSVTFNYFDDVIVAEPRWVADGATISPSVSGLTYSASIRWETTGMKTVEFRDGTSVLASLQVEVSVGCNPPPKPDAGTDQLLCGQSTTMLSASSPGNFTGKWSIVSGTGGAVANLDLPNSTFTGLTGTVYTLRWTVTNGNCGSSSDDVTISVQSKPVIPVAVNGNSRFGSGNVTLTVPTSDLTLSYRWFSADGKWLYTGSTFVTPTVTASQNPFGSVRSVSAAGCASDPLTFAVTIEPLPVISAGGTRVVLGQPVRLSTSATYSTYAWKNEGGQVISTASACDVITPGNYWLTVTRSGVNGTGTSLPVVISGQFDGMAGNRVVTEIISKSGISDPSTIGQLSGTIQQVTYTDGLGRVRHEIHTQGSPARKDIIRQTDWDRYGRMSRNYLPALSGASDGRMASLLVGPNGELATYSDSSDDVADDARPFRENIYEASPLDRVSLAYGEGQNWKTNERPESFFYAVNIHGTSTGQEQIPVWKLDKTTGFPIRDLLSGNGFYGTGMLEVQSVRDENGNILRRYFDRMGNMVLQKTQAVSNPVENAVDHWARTVYIYDELSRLRWVLQPELVKNLLLANRNPTPTELVGMAFRYRYDALGRVAARQEPGRDSVLMVYDSRNRLVLTQDGNQRQAAPYRWTFYKYDAFNRLIASGIKDTAAIVAQPVMQAVINAFYRTKPWALLYEQLSAGSASVHGYTNKSYPVVTTGNVMDPESYLTVTYYDQYRFLQDWPSGYSFRSDQRTGVTSITRVTGLVTGEKEKVLDGGTTWLRTVKYYDEQYGLLQTISDNYKGGSDILTWSRDFIGRIISQRTLHQEGDVTWKDVALATPLGNRLIRTNATAGWTSGAVSAQQLPAGQDGWMEFSATSGSSIRCAGLSDVNTNTNYTTIDYAVYLNSNGTISIYEQSSSKFVVANAGTFRTGDVFRVQRTAGTIRYYRNGSLLYTSLTPSSSVLMADVSLNSPDATIAGVRTSFSTMTRLLEQRFEYDHAGRVIADWHRLDGGQEILLAANRYNEIGQLINRKIHSNDASASTARQSVDYRYHIRGWITAVNNSDLNGRAGEPKDLFGEEWFYETSMPGLGAIPRFDGSASSYATSNATLFGPISRTAMSFSYDPLNRLTGGNQWLGSTTGSWMQGSLSERVTDYDLNGNIRTLTRKNSNGITVDNLSYTYAAGTNRLEAVQDNTASATDRAAGFLDGNAGNAEYTYDRNGNQLTDLNKGFVSPINYNLLDEAEVIRRGDNRVHNIVTATGRMVARIAVYPGTLNAAPYIVRQTDFCGPFIYDQDQLQQITHPDGRIMLQSGRQLFMESGTSPQAYVPSGVTLSATTLNGGEKYLAVTSLSTTARSGVMAVGGTAVQAGDRLLIRLRAYRMAGTAKSSNPAYVSVKLNGADLVWPGAAVPLSSASEHRVEQIVVVPSAGTLTAGVNWSTVVAAGEVIYINEFEIIRLSAQSPEYQYFIRDAQGNVRVTFTADPKTDARQATMETASSAEERMRFLRYDNARLVNAALFDRTNGKSSGWSARLNGSNNERYGMAVSLAVMPGDVVSAEAFAKFIDPSSANWTAALATLMSQVATSATGVVADGTSYSSSTGSFPFGGLLSGAGSVGNGPRFYLNWLVFDKDYNFLQSQSGFARLSSASREYGQDVAHERMAMPALTIGQPGFVYIYLSNEELTPIEVYYDDFRVTHQQSPLLQRVDYNPFGLTALVQERENILPQTLLFGSAPLRRELGLDDYDFGARYYSPAGARSWQLDPLAGKFDRWSPYSWSGNDPVNNIDPDGRDWYRANGSDGKMDPKGEVIWRRGSDPVKGYTNIGSRYTFTVTEKNGSEVTYTYEQINLVEKIEMVMPVSGWMTQNPSINPRGCKTCCYKVSRDMVAEQGVQLTKAYNPKSLTVASDRGYQDGKRVFRKTAEHQRGIDIINKTLDAGKPVVVGVDHSAGTRNIDGITDHFIVIAGRVTDYVNSSVSFRYFDPGNGRAAQGAAVNNILRNVGGLYQSDHYFRGTGRHYTLTHVVQ